MLKQSLLEQFQENLKQNTTRHCPKTAFFLWGYLKNKVYSGVKATTLAGLKLRIQEAFEETRLETMSLIKTYDNALYRMKLVSENGGKHIEISVKNRKNLGV